MTVAILFHRVGPYHHVRLTAINKSIEIVSIEFSKIDYTYAWTELVVEKDYLFHSVFEDDDIDNKPAHIVSEKIKNSLTSLQPKLVAIPGWSSPAALAALAWCCSFGIPAVLMSDSAAHDSPRTWWGELIKSRIVRMFSAAMVGGTPHVEYVCALGMAPNKVFVGYDVVDNNYFLIEANKIRVNGPAFRRQHDLPDQYFLASNRFIEKKNLSRLLEAYAIYVLRAGNAAWSLVLLGDGELKQAIMAQVAHLRLTDRVSFPGFKQYNELPIYYGLANAFVHTSTTEQWGLVVNEAMASGLPLLVSDRCGCVSDLVHNGVNGYTFDPYDIKELSELMVQIAGESCDLVSMGQASLEIIARWSPEAFAAGMMKSAVAAMSSPLPRIGWFDRAILWVLMRR